MQETPGNPASTTPDSLEARLRAALAPNLLLVREIGAGGMARVFLAREPALKRLVAVKVLSGELAGTDAGRARFEREAQAVAGLSHPNVVAVHMVGELDDGTPYFIMQYVEGLSLSERVTREGALSVAEARRALGEVAAALAAAHAQGIIHRDVKPANILYEEASGRSLVTDFGIAAVGRDAAPVNVKLTATGSIIGTPQYMSPEQLLAEPVTEKTDVYSLGLLAHEMLCGSPPFKSTSPHELIAAHLRDVPAKLSVRRVEVDSELDAIVASCLEKDATQRPNASEVARRLTPGGSALLEWPPPGLDELLGSLRDISSLALLGASTVTFVLLGILAAGVTIRSALSSLATTLLVVAAIAGTVPLAVALYRAIRAGIAAERAIKNGYAWMTVLEAVSDVRGDTGNLISASREYAGLKASERDRFRRGRVTREAALLIGGLGSLPLFALTVVLGSLDATGWSLAWISMLPPAAGLLTAVMIEGREHRAFGARRSRRKTAAADVSRLSTSWYETFEDARKGQTIGRGRADFPGAGRWATDAAAAILTVLIFLLTPIVVVGTIGPSYWSLVLPSFANPTGKIRIANLARPYMVSKDPTISAIAAGQAFYSLTGSFARPNPGLAEDFPQRPIPVQLPRGPWEDAMAPDLFPKARFDFSPGVPASNKVFVLARAGLSERELAYLGRVAAAPHWQLYDRVAKANSMDYFGARFMPYGPHATPGRMPILPYVSTKGMAYASIARAAYYLARGRRDSAEQALRSSITVGFKLIDDGNFILDGLIGAVMVGISRQGLVDYFKAIGDPRGQALQAQVDAIVAQIEASVARDRGAPLDGADLTNVRGVRAAIMRIAADDRELRANRLAMMDLLARTPCTNMRELVFGVSPEAKAVFAQQRKLLTRFPSDSAFFNLVEHQVEVPARKGGHWTLLTLGARIVGSTLGNKRLSGCVGLLSDFVDQ